MNTRKRILVIDDDREICDFIEDLLSFRFAILKAHTAETGLQMASKENPDIVILDLKLEEHDGLDVCKALRESTKTKHIPILVYSGSEDADSSVAAFERGADDYIVKTTRPRELVARILSKIRRLEEKESDPDVIICGNLTLDVAKLEASVNQRPIQLSVLEFNLLRFFVTNKERVVSRQAILDGVWRDATVSNRTIDTHMVHLRKKLDGFNHMLATVYGAGYILRSERPQQGTNPASSGERRVPGDS